MSNIACIKCRGVASRDVFLITKAYRDAHPLQCEGKPEEKFIYPANYDYSFDNVPLSGYNGGPTRRSQAAAATRKSTKVSHSNNCV
jgi:hypothetical protein